MAYVKPQVNSIHYPAFLENMPDLTGKVFVITGTTSGTGRVAVRAIAQKNAKVIMLNRPSSRSKKAQEELSQGFTDGHIVTVDCDLQRFASVKVASEKVNELCAESGIFALINNAGIMAMPDEATEDGFDIQMQTNHLSHFLLTRELFPLLTKGSEIHGDARIVNHSSMARKTVKDLDAKYFEANGGHLGGNGSSMIFGGARWVRYGQTKLANAAFTAALHHRLRDCNSKVRALVAHPGWANTELQVTTNKADGMASMYSAVARYFSQSEEDGALGIISCAVLPEAQCGAFYGPGLGMMATKGKAMSYSLEKQYDNNKTRELLWRKSCEAIGLEFDI